MLQNLIFFYKRKIAPGFFKGKKSKVLDIGSGDKPFWRGDVFFDKLDLPNNQRFTETGVVQNLGLFIDGDITKTPFKDKAFDFSFCSHLLEHVQRPDLAIKEITRVSKMGYIETPNGLVESIAPYQSHLWFIYLNGKKLIFVRKSKKIHDVLTKNGLTERQVLGHFNNIFIRLYWKNKIDFEIIDNLRESEKFFPINKQSLKQLRCYNNLKEEGMNQSLYILIVRILRFLFYLKKTNLEEQVLKRH